MNYMKMFLAAISMMISQQTFCMFFPSAVWRNEPQELNQVPYSYMGSANAQPISSMINFADIEKYEGSKSVSQLARKTRKEQRRAAAQAQADAQAKEEAKKQAAIQAKKQRAALDQQIAAAEEKADCYLLSGGNKGKSRKK